MRRITSASAMVFMQDSERAAALAQSESMEVGLHLNLTAPFSAAGVNTKIRESQRKVASYLTRHKLAQVLYNPILSTAFKITFTAQQDEFVRLYGRAPAFYNGHHHMHLCANIMVGNVIPRAARVRTTFSFAAGEKSVFNFLYRQILTAWISKMFISTDLFFSIRPIERYDRLQWIMGRAEEQNVEIEVHPEDRDELSFLLSDEYSKLLDSMHCGRFEDLARPRIIGTQE